MKVPFRTYASFGLALGMIGLGYQLGAAPSVITQPAPASPPVAAAKLEPVPVAKAPTALVANRPPVPLVTAPRPASYVPPAEPQTASVSTDNKSTVPPTVNMGTFSSNPSDGRDVTQALSMPGDDARAKKAIEFDGYRNVGSLVKQPDGTWRGRAMRGRTEIAVRVDANGNVSAE